MRILFLIPLLFISGCVTLIEKGVVVDGKRIATEFIRIKGIGGGTFPDGTKGEGKPMVEMPKFELDN